MNLQPHHIGIVVSDLERSTDFYRALGFEVVKDLPVGGRLAGDPLHPPRRVRDRAVLVRRARRSGRSAGGQGAARLPSPRASYRRHRRHAQLAQGARSRARRARGPQVPIGYSILFLSDPDGLEIEIMQED